MKYFRCEPNGCATSITGCAKRHLKVMTPGQGYGRTSLDVIHAGACANCPVGAAHALGGSPTEWPDGKRIVRADSPSGLGYNVHKPELGRGVGMHRRGGITVAAGAPPPTKSREVKCACGRWYIGGGNRQRCGVCSGEARAKAHRVRSAMIARKPGSGQRKLTEAQVIEMRRRARAGASFAQLARETGVAAETVSDAVRGASWAHVKDGLV
jgi:hypothetical protein